MVSKKHASYGKHQRNGKQNKIFDLRLRERYKFGNGTDQKVNNHRGNKRTDHQPLLDHKHTDHVQQKGQRKYQHRHAEAFHYVAVSGIFLILEIFRYLFLRFCFLHCTAPPCCELRLSGQIPSFSHDYSTMRSGAHEKYLNHPSSPETLDAFTRNIYNNIIDKFLQRRPALWHYPP